MAAHVQYIREWMGGGRKKRLKRMAHIYIKKQQQDDDCFVCVVVFMWRDTISRAVYRKWTFQLDLERLQHYRRGGLKIVNERAGKNGR